MTILIVEDEYLIADDLMQVLLDQGADVIGPIATLDAAMAAVAERRPDLAVLDINLRGQPVFPLADLLTAQRVPFVFTTGYDAGAIPERFTAAPRHEKPIRVADLLATLGRLATRRPEAPLAPAPGAA